MNRLKQWLLFQPLKRKILWVIMTVVIVTVVSVSGFLYWHNDQQHRQDFIRNNLVLVKLVGEYTILPLVFEDKTGTNEQLSRLLQDPRIVYIRLKNAKGEIMTDYDPFNIAASAPLLDAEQEYRWLDNHLYFAISIDHNDQKLGTLTGAFRLDEYKHLQYSELVFIIAAVLVAVICSFFMALLLRQFVMSSIQQLETHARRIAQQPGQDELFAYPKRRNDEVSQLYEAFNLLMQQVRTREAEILQLNANLEAKVKQRTEDLTAALRIKSAFLANMSHEIRTPMNAILGMLHLTLQTELLPNQLNYITKANDAAKWLLGVINDILDYSKLESGKISLEKTSFQLESIIQHLEDVTMPLLKGKPVILQFSVDSDMPTLVGDQLRLGQILLNLTSNAIKFTESGTISVQIKLLNVAAEQATVQFSVIDTGIGISEEQQQYLFKPFTQADNSTTRQYGGTGLGLTISKELVEAMGGSISLESRLGIGSRFSFTVELGVATTTAPVHERLPQPSSHRWERFAGVPLLLVEDNQVNQELVLDVLGKYGLKVDLACNGAEAVALVEKNNYAAVLMDCLMPVMDGYVATQTIRSNPRFADLPIIAMTANVMAEERQRCLASGMNDHIGKPIDWNKLLATLVRWIGARSLPVTAMTESNLEHEFPMLAGVDHKMAEKFVSGNVALYRKLLSTIQKKHAGGMTLIKSAYRSGDNQAAARQAHTLSGAFSAIGALQLSSVMDTLEDNFNNNPDHAAINPLLQQAEIGFNQIMSEIDGICQQSDASH